MARYIDTQKDQGLLLAVNLSDQIIPGTFEYTLSNLIDNKLDLSIVNRKYNNDYTGALAIEPRILLKIIIYCYKMGVISSRKIAKLCEKHLVVKALAEDIEPHYTTISNFVSGMGGEIGKVFSEVLLVCDEMGLIKGKMFAEDGCRLPSNASKEWSGTKEELKEKYDKIKKICTGIVEKHKNNDKLGKKEKEAEEKKRERLEKKAEKILEFLGTHEDRTGSGGEVIKLNVTDNESGTIKGPHGVIQGYNGIAVVDSENQVIVAANAYGSVYEGQYFPEMLEETERNMRMIKGEENPLEGTIILADTDYFSEENLQAAKKKEMEAVIPDEQYRNRDGQLKEGERREGKERLDARYFKYDENENCYICPNGKVLTHRGKVKLNRNEGNKYDSKASDCKGCPYADKCIHAKGKEKKYRTLLIPVTEYEENECQKMREKIDTEKYKKIYSKRLGIVEPVFADITYCKGITRFTLRTRKKVNIQWLLYCVVHNIGKYSMGEKMEKAKRDARKRKIAA
jgi:transposase